MEINEKILIDTLVAISKFQMESPERDAIYNTISNFEIKDFEDFENKINRPTRKALKDTVENKLDTKDFLHKFILVNRSYVERNIEAVIQRKEGYGCCYDKTITILRAVHNFYNTGKKIEWNYDQQYTFQLPTKVFVNHEEIMNYLNLLEKIYYANKLTKKELKLLIKLWE